MRNEKHIMYTHGMYVCFQVKSSDCAVAHGASQCFALSQGTNCDKAKHCEAPCAMRNGAVRRFDLKTNTDSVSVHYMFRIAPGADPDRS